MSTPETGIPAAELLALLRKAELFSGLLDDDLAYVAERCELLRVERQASLFGPGEKARRFFIVREGEISVWRAEGAAQAAGTAESRGRVREREIARYVAGDVIADFDFAVGSSHDARARAETASLLLAFPGGGRSMEDLALEKPDTVARVLLRSLSMISSRLRSTHRLISENAPWVRELRRQIYTDPGTGLWSRAFLEEEIPRSLERPTAIVLLKPDRFKELNDARGHAAGDEAMERVAEILRAEAEELGRGWPLRLRSNETALVVPRCPAPEAAEVSRRLAAAVARVELPAEGDAPAFAFTASIALASWPGDGEDWRRLVESAYGLLTKAWKDGGARVYRFRHAPREARQ